MNHFTTANTKRTSAWLAIGLLLTSLCACSPTWQNVRKEETIKGPVRAYTAVLPEGWKRAPTDSDVLVITRDGLFLQQISITKFSLDEAFEGIAITADIPAQQLAQLQFKRFKADEPDLVRTVSDEKKGLLGMFPVSHAKPLAGTTERLALKPFKVDGKEAYRLETRAYNGWGLAYTSHAVGFVHEDDYWVVRYLAPTLHYAQRDQATFERFLENLKLKAKCRLFCSD
jgi:hypothetical protein